MTKDTSENLWFCKFHFVLMYPLITVDQYLPICANPDIYKNQLTICAFDGKNVCL